MNLKKKNVFYIFYFHFFVGWVGLGFMAYQPL